MSQPVSLGVSSVSLAQTTEETFKWEGIKPIPGLITFSVGLAIYLAPVPLGLSVQAWHLFAFFVSIIVGMITRPLPVAAVVLIAVIGILTTGTLEFAQVFSSYQSKGIWLLVTSFFLARGLVTTQLAARAGYFFVSIFGKRTLGLAYGIILSELVLAPFIPSLIARSGCIIFPIIMALNENVKSIATKKTVGFLSLAVFQGSLICSALFLTGTAVNPLVAELALDQGLEITWLLWFKVAVAPAAVSLVAIPLLVYYIYPPDVLETPEAPKMAKKKLEEMGAFSIKEWMMSGIFLIVLTLWLLDSSLHIGTAVVCFIGVALILLTGVLQWEDCLKEKAAWDILLWLGIIFSLGVQLKNLGFFSWFSGFVVDFIGDTSWQFGFMAIVLVYFYSHYFFASNVAHLSAMFFVFYATALDMGVPVLLATLLLGFVNSLFGGLTHYSCGPAPIYFGAGFLSMKDWWKAGFLCGTANLIIWGTITPLWMKVLGLY